MKTTNKAVIAAIALTALGIQAAHANGEIGCPDGTAVQGVDFVKRKLVCVPVGSGGSGALKVMDANNEQAGVFIGFGFLARLVNNEWTLLTFDSNGFMGGAFAVYYESNDCTGPAYIPDFSGTAIPKVVGSTVNGAFVTIYSPAPGTFADRTVQSFQNLSSAGFDACQSMAASVQTLGVPQTTTISNNPPFRISQ